MLQSAHRTKKMKKYSSAEARYSLQKKSKKSVANTAISSDTVMSGWLHINSRILVAGARLSKSWIYTQSRFR
jgi:hypothetical protein